MTVTVCDIENDRVESSWIYPAFENGGSFHQSFFWDCLPGRVSHHFSQKSPSKSSWGNQCGTLPGGCPSTRTRRPATAEDRSWVGDIVGIIYIYIKHQWEIIRPGENRVYQNLYPLVNCHITMERSTIFHGKIHYFDWVIFNSYVTNYQRVFIFIYLDIIYIYIMYII